MELSKESAVFFLILERDLQITIPCHIKNILNVRGFNNAFIFKSIEDSDILEMQQYTRQKLSKFIRSSLNDEEQFEDISVNFFGQFSNMPTEFEFQNTEKELLKKLVCYVKSMVDANNNLNRGLAHFLSVEDANIGNQRYFSQPKKSEPITKDSHTHFVLKRLTDTADQNISRNKAGYRFGDDIKHFAAYIRMVAGPHAYETIQRNLELALPTLKTMNRFITKTSDKLIEGRLRSNDLLEYLKLRELPLVVSLSEDATRIEGRPQYDSKTNQIMGLILPMNSQNGMPIPGAYPARNAHEMASHFLNQGATAHLVNVIMAQPLANVAPFCLLLFTSDSKYTAEFVMKRWKFITAELVKLNIHVLSISSDSFPTYNSAMRKATALGSDSNIFGDVQWFKFGSNISHPFYIQDTTHVATKLRNFFLKTAQIPEKLPFGQNLFIQLDHLKFLLDKFPKDHHQLTISTIDPNDRQNFESVLRITSDEVISLMKSHVPNSKATVIFLEITRRIIDSYMNPRLSPAERIEKLWYSVFLIRIWREYVISRKDLTLKENFLTMNCYACIEINAHSLILIVLSLEKYGMPHLFLPSLMDSQPCEGFFRQIRSFTSTYSMVANCTVKEMVGRINKIQLQNDIAFLSQFKFPRIKTASSLGNSQNIRMYKLPNAEEILNMIERSKTAAIEVAVQMGLIETEDIDEKVFACKIPFLGTKTVCDTTTIAKNVGRKINFQSVTKLKNFAEKFIEQNVPVDSAYVEINCYKTKRYIVKKTSLCWLLRTDSEKLSSDRRLRVKQPECLTTIRTKGKRGKVRRPIPRQKVIKRKVTGK